MTCGFLEILAHLEKKKCTPTYGNLIRGLQNVLKKKKYEQIPQLSSGNLIDLDKEFVLS
jgi:hypothetical protein